MHGSINEVKEINALKILETMSENANRSYIKLDSQQLDDTEKAFLDNSIIETKYPWSIESGTPEGEINNISVFVSSLERYGKESST